MSENTGHTPSNDTNRITGRDHNEMAKTPAEILREDLKKSLAKCAECSGNIDCHTYEIMKRNLEYGPLTGVLQEDLE